MILEEETKEAFGYYTSELTPQSNKHILAACDECGTVRITSKNAYRALCTSCARKGENNPNYSKHHTEEAKALMSAAATLRTGDKSPNYKGGKRMRIARKNAKRKRDLGYTLLIPLAEGEVGHHVTNEYVIGIPKEIHKQFSGYKRKKHRSLVLQCIKVYDMRKYKIALSVLEQYRI